MARRTRRPRGAAALGAVAAAGLALLPPAGAATAQQPAPAVAAAPAEARVADGLLARRADGSGFEPVRFDPRSAPLALRFNNYFAVKQESSRDPWLGQAGADGRGYARFEDPAYAVRAFVELVRAYHGRGDRSAADVFRRLSPAGDCSGAPSASAAAQAAGATGCPENERQGPVSAGRAARAVGLGPDDDLGLFGPDGAVASHAALRALLDAAATQEVGLPFCPQPPDGEAWIGCRVDDALVRRGLDLPRARPG